MPMMCIEQDEATRLTRWLARASNEAGYLCRAFEVDPFSSQAADELGPGQADPTLDPVTSLSAAADPEQAHEIYDPGFAADKVLEAAVEDPDETRNASAETGAATTIDTNGN